MSGVDASGQPATGFAGLTALATALPPEPAFTKEPPKRPAGDAAPKAALDARRVENPTFWTAGRRWAAVGAGVLAVVGFANLPKDGGSHRTPSSSTTYAPSASYEPERSIAPAQPSFVAPAAREEQHVEVKPSVGTGQILSRNEIRYCLSEKVRMEAMGDYIDATKRVHIERFNALVGDYNARCSNYRYRQSDMTSASTAVDASGSRLRAQAADMVGQWR